MNKNVPESPLAYIFVIFSKWRRLFFINFFIFAALGVTISLLLPKWYRAESTIIPSVSYSGFDITAALNPFQGGQFPFGTSDDLMKFLGILKSRTVQEAAIREFDLMKLWKSRDMDVAVRTMQKRVVIEINDEGLIVVRVWEKKPQLAADLANFFVGQLQEVNIELSTQSARANRVFLEDRVEEINIKLAGAEEELRCFQEANGAYSIPEQTKAMIETAAEIQAHIYMLEVEIQVLEGSMKPDHPQLVNKQLELNELKKTLQSLQSDNLESNETGFQIPFERIPEVGMTYIRLYREAEKHQKILEYLIPQLEQARLEEVKNTPSVQVLDEAKPPFRKAKPVRSHLTLIILFIGMLLTAAYALLAEKWIKVKEEQKDTYQQIAHSWNAIISDLKFWRWKK